MPTLRVARRLTLPALGALLAAVVLAGCADKVSPTGKTQADRVTPPELGACHALEPDDVEKPSDASKPVSCSEDHTAETFAIGTFPDRFAAASYDTRRSAASSSTPAARPTAPSSAATSPRPCARS